jgi:exodeoxyribonuclease-3
VQLATWNVNSVRARHDRLLAFLERHAPDVVCLQETKVVAEQFPVAALAEAGYASQVVGQKTYNGVAILSREAPSDSARAFGDGGDDSEARFLAVRVGGIRVASVYVPNGRSVGHDHYVYKLEWLARLRRWLEKHADPAEPLAVLGDFNVAPADADVHDPDAWQGQVLCSEPERQAYRELLSWGLHDSFRELRPDDVAYTWWDYRQLGFPKNRGLRIDHVLMTAPLLARCREVRVDREERKGKSPSDHAPVIATLDS